MCFSIPKKFLSPHRALQCTCCKITTICLAWMSASQTPEIAYLFIYWELLLYYWSSWPQVIGRVRLVKSVRDFSYSKICRKLQNQTFYKTSITWTCAIHIHAGMFQSRYLKNLYFFIMCLNVPCDATQNMVRCEQCWRHLYPSKSFADHITEACSALLHMHTSSFPMSNMQNFCLSTPLKTTRK